MPRDEKELERCDMGHEKYYLLLENNRYLAPIGENPGHVLDLGTGTGIWSMDFADTFTSSRVIGVDIAPTQPSVVPPNCFFEIDDIESDWALKKESFDFIFSRDLVFAIRDWPKLIHQAFEHLKPGGWIEFQCIHGVLGCDDGSLPDDSSFRQYDKLVQEAAIAFGTPLDDPARWKEWFQKEGFEDVVEKRFKVPSNTWPKDPRMKLVGAFEKENMLEGLEGFSVRLFQRGLGWTPEETNILLEKVRNEIRNKSIHAYYPL